MTVPPQLMTDPTQLARDGIDKEDEFSQNKKASVPQIALRRRLAVLADWFPGFAPASRMEMRGNFYNCGDFKPRPHYAAWNDIPEVVPDFHRSKYFGKLIFTR